ncbi:hypothetical protein MVEN_02341600 [Mycena venus]|uniref:Uncharacterized protein n=1 Tax=Mycena venus TaxID=2733690 RepID=A0A8H6X452_9AGAR|nr:hypothetical protein MVEN_02341600 [Mycena venus]
MSPPLSSRLRPALAAPSLNRRLLPTPPLALPAPRAFGHTSATSADDSRPPCRAALPPPLHVARCMLATAVTTATSRSDSQRPRRFLTHTTMLLPYPSSRTVFTLEHPSVFSLRHLLPSSFNPPISQPSFGSLVNYFALAARRLSLLPLTF